MFIQGGRRPPCMNMRFSLKPTPAVAPAAFGLLDLATGLRLLAPAPPAQIFVFFLLVVHILFLIDGAEIHIGNVLILLISRSLGLGCGMSDSFGLAVR